MDESSCNKLKGYTGEGNYLDKVNKCLTES